jgi:hypothetical protein
VIGTYEILAAIGVAPALRLRQLADAVCQAAHLFHGALDLGDDTADNACDAQNRIGYPVETPGHLLKICSELGLVIKQKLHRPLHLLARHRLKIREIRLAQPGHYAIVC